MKYYWYFTKDRQIVLTNVQKSMGDMLYSGEIIGRVARQKDGGWLCYYRGLCIGKEPNAEYAQKTVEQVVAGSGR